MATATDNLEVLNKLADAYGLGRLSIDTMIGRLAAYVSWVREGACIIRDKAGVIHPLQFNAVQRLLLNRIVAQAAAGEPIRKRVLKSRKPGISTLVQTLFAFFVQHFRNQIAVTLAHLPQSTSEIFEIAQRCSQHWCRLSPDEIQAHRLVVPDLGSRLWCHTAGGGSIAVGGTPNLMHLSEVALWRVNKGETYLSALNAVPDDPNTIIVEESSGRGREEFFENWERTYGQVA